MEIGKLTASFEANTRAFDSSLKQSEVRLEALKARIKDVQREAATPFKGARLNALKDLLGTAVKDHKALQAAQKQTAESAKDMAADMQGALSSVSPKLAAFAGAAGPFSLIAAAAIAAVAGVGLFTKALFDLAVATAGFQGKLYDLSQQTGVSVETLSALDVMAAQTGSDLGAVTASLGIFQKNLEAARDPTDRMAEAFSRLGVETDNTEEALRESLKALAKMPEGYHQTAIALQIFGRGGKALLAILKEMDGDLDGTINKLDEMGILIKTHVSVEADRFNDQMVVLDRQMRAVGATIGVEVMPAVIAAVNNLSTALKENEKEIHAVGVAAGIAAGWLSGQFAQAIGIAEAAIWASMPGFNAMVAVLNKIHDLTSTLGPVSGGASGVMNVAGGIGSAATSGGDVSIGKGIFRRRGAGGGGRGGGGGRAKAAKDLGEDFDEYYNLFDHFKKMEEDRLDANKRISDELERQHDRMTDILLTTLQINQEAMEFGGVHTATGDLEKFLEIEPPDISAQSQAILDMRQRMRDLGSELTGIFHESIGAGFEQGVKRGLVTLAQGLLDIVQNVFLNRLAEGLGNILADFATPSSGKGGSLLQKGLGFLFGAVAGGVGAGVAGPTAAGATAGPWGGGWLGANGGFVPGVDKGYDSVAAMLQPGELVLNKRQQGMMGNQVVNNYTINLPPSPKGGYSSPKSQRELGDKLLAMLQGSQA